MPMIDIYASPGTFADPARLAREAASEIMAAERLPDLPIFRANTAAFVHDVLFLADVNGDGACVRVQVLTPHGALDRDKQRDAVARLTTLVTSSSAVPPDRVWVLLTEAAEGGWGIAGRALSTEDIAAVARQT